MAYGVMPSDIKGYRLDTKNSDGLISADVSFSQNEYFFLDKPALPCKVSQSKNIFTARPNMGPDPPLPHPPPLTPNNH